MKNNIIKFLIIIMSVIMLSGCYNYKEINNYAIVSGISIDTYNENEYEVGVQIMNAKKEENSTSSLITFYKSHGKTIYEALEQIMLKSPKELYLGHNEVLIISEALLRKKNPLNYLDYFLRDSEVEKKSLVIISKKSKASDILKIITPLETIPSKNLKQTLTVANKFSGILSLTTIDEFVSLLKKDGIEPVLPAISIKGEISSGKKESNISTSDPKTKPSFISLGFFENGKLKDYLTKEESFGYNLLTNNLKKAYINIKCDSNNYSSIRISNSKVRKKINYDKENIYVNFNINIQANLLEYNCNNDFFSDKKSIRELEKKANEKIKLMINKTENILYYKNNADCLGIKEKLLKNKINLKNFNNKNIIFNNKIKTKLTSTNLSIRSIKEK